MQIGVRNANETLLRIYERPDICISASRLPRHQHAHVRRLYKVRPVSLVKLDHLCLFRLQELQISHTVAMVDVIGQISVRVQEVSSELEWRINMTMNLILRTTSEGRQVRYTDPIFSQRCIICVEVSGDSRSHKLAARLQLGRGVSPHRFQVLCSS